MADGGCARDYAEAARKALASELVEVGKVAVRDYIIGQEILSYKAFQNAIAEDWGERFRPYTLSLWQTASQSYNKLLATNPSLGLPPLEAKPVDFVPDYHNLDRLSDVDAGKQAVQNLVSLAEAGALKGFRGDYDVKPLSDSQTKAEALIEDETLFQAISKQFSIPFDDVVNAQRLMMDALIYEQRSKSVLVELAQENLDKLISSGAGSVALDRAEQELGDALTESRMVTSIATFYTGLAEGNLTAAGRALRMARETAKLRRSGASGEAFVALFGNASMKAPVPLGMTETEALKAATTVTPEKAKEITERARQSKIDRVEKTRQAAKSKVSNKISGELGAKDLFGDNMPFAPQTKQERAANVKAARSALRKSGVKDIKENTEAFNNLTDMAKRLKALLGKQDGAC